MENLLKILLSLWVFLGAIIFAVLHYRKSDYKDDPFTRLILGPVVWVLSFIGL